MATTLLTILPGASLKGYTYRCQEPGCHAGSGNLTTKSLAVAVQLAESHADFSGHVVAVKENA